MGIHKSVRKGSKPVSFAGLRFFEAEEFVGISFRGLSTSWPILAKKLNGLGILGRIEFQAGKVMLKTSAPLPFLKALVQGHGKKSRFSKVLIAATALSVFGVTSMVPLRLDSEQNIVEEKTSHQNPCDVSTLTKWLEGTDNADEVIPVETSVLGGITAGILECSGARYSYTLGSADTKRVLKLQKLDS